MRQAKTTWLLTRVLAMGFLSPGIGPASAQEGEHLSKGVA